MAQVSDEDLTREVLHALRRASEEHKAETRSLVKRAKRTGAKSHDIAQALNVSRATLWRHYTEELSRKPTSAYSPSTAPDGSRPTRSPKF